VRELRNRGVGGQQNLTTTSVSGSISFVVVGERLRQRFTLMASPVQRSRRQRPVSIARVPSLGRAATANETTPFNRALAAEAVASEALAETIPFPRASSVAVKEVTIGEAFGPYVVYEKLGEGGMAFVHRAELVVDGDLRKPVALKRLHSHAAEDPDFVAAFVHEAQLAAKLRHPNIAQAFDLGKIESSYYIAMELVSGPTLAQIMMASRGGAGAVPLPIALEILIQLCDALDHAHDLRDEAGRPLDLVHRDVSPMNVIISKTGIVKLIDFGIAKDRSARRQTEAGYIKGKHAYVAPEYTYGQLDRRCDLWGLGVVAHELLTGRRLFAGGNDADTIRNVRSMLVPPPSRHAPGISPELDRIVLKALEREPTQRWQNAGEMRAALTDERHRLGVAVTGRQIREWAEWAFRQTPRRNSSVDRMLEGCDPSLSVSIEVECPPVPREASVHSDQLALGSGPTAQINQDEVPTVDGAEPVAALAATIRASQEDFVISAPARAAAPRATSPIAALVASPVAAPVVANVPAKGRPRAPRWRPPTRWAHPQRRRSLAPLFLLALMGLAAFLVYQGIIDVDRWREIIDAYV
jgi:serine/threonine protein kinase